jgi:nitrogen regulatory protein PII
MTDRHTSDTDPTNRCPPAPDPDGADLVLVLAFVRPDRLDRVKNALTVAGVRSLTVTAASGRGTQPPKLGQWRGERYAVDLHARTRVEVVVAADAVDRTVTAVRDAAFTGDRGDGKVFVLGVDGATRIRTGEGEHAAF